MTDRCKCSHKTTCGRTPGQWDYPACPLEYIECYEAHLVNECEHVFDGWEEFEGGGTAVCSLCDLTATAHDMRWAP